MKWSKDKINDGDISKLSFPLFELERDSWKSKIMAFLKKKKKKLRDKYIFLLCATESRAATESSYTINDAETKRVLDKLTI